MAKEPTTKKTAKKTAKKVEVIPSAEPIAEPVEQVKEPQEVLNDPERRDQPSGNSVAESAEVPVKEPQEFVEAQAPKETGRWYDKVRRNGRNVVDGGAVTNYKRPYAP